MQMSTYICSDFVKTLGSITCAAIISSAMRKKCVLGLRRSGSTACVWKRSEMGLCGAGGDFLDHPAARREFIAFVNLLGDVHGDDAAFRPCGAQNFSRRLRIEKNIERVGEHVEAGSHDHHFVHQRNDVGRERDRERQIRERSAGIDRHLAGIFAHRLDDEARGVFLLRLRFAKRS